MVDTNYKILYDEEDEGKTELIIRPADTASDYAVLDLALIHICGRRPLLYDHTGQLVSCNGRSRRKIHRFSGSF